jgi:hypothetical protein
MCELKERTPEEGAGEYGCSGHGGCCVGVGIDEQGVCVGGMDLLSISRRGQIVNLLLIACDCGVSKSMRLVRAVFPRFTRLLVEAVSSCLEHRVITFTLRVLDGQRRRQHPLLNENGYHRTTMADITNPTTGTLDWRLSAHPITLVTFLGFRACEHMRGSPRGGLD